MVAAFSLAWLYANRNQCASVAGGIAGAGILAWRFGARGVPRLTAWLAPVFAMLWLGLGSARAVFALGAVVYFITFGWIARTGTWIPPWCRLGHTGRTSWAVAFFVGAACGAAVLALVACTGQTPALPAWVSALPAPMLIASGIAFAAVNALLEEAVFRGIFMDALEADAGRVAAVLGQAVAFAVIHENGVPGGTSGMFAAGVFGILMGVLRYRSRGMFAPVLCHFVAGLVIVAWALSQRQ